MKQFKNVSLDENLDALNPFAKFRTNAGNSTYSSIYGLVRTGPTGPTGPTERIIYAQNTCLKYRERFFW